MRQGGFTLLEMIVVLGILGLATAIVAPSAIRGIDSWRRQSAMDALLDQIRALPGDARASGRAINISEAALKSASPPLRIESDWALAVPAPWKVNANGVCEDGHVEVRNRHGARIVAVRAPFCDPQVLP